ncbi:MAG: aldo/keto reductase [Aggregatilineales bacterium]
MQTRRLGRTENQSSVVIFGSAAFWEIGQDEANAALELALESGINHIDVAPQYGQAEERVGAWLAPHRDEFFLGCKTLERERGAAWDELHVSLKKLNTEQFDLYQLHAVTSMDELNKAFASGGAIEALQQARDAGLTKYLGITGHGLDVPNVFIEALERFDFDTVMFPIYPALYANADYRQQTERLLEMCVARDVGVMIIKAVAKQGWGGREKVYNTWYEPYDMQDRINQSVRFALSQPGVTGIPSAGDTRILPMVINAVEQFTPMPADEQEALIADTGDLIPVFE